MRRRLENIFDTVQNQDGLEEMDDLLFQPSDAYLETQRLWLYFQHGVPGEETAFLRPAKVKMQQKGRYLPLYHLSLIHI